MVDISAILGRRRSENRIKRKVRASNLPQYNDEEDIDRALRNIGDKAYTRGSRIFQASQARKAEGKEILKHTIKHSIGETYRAFVGPRRTQPNAPKISTPKIPKLKRRKH